MKKDHIIAGLDIGSSKVAFIIGSIKEQESGEQGLDVIGIGTAPNQGLRKGVVVNIEATTEAIQKAREEAELMAGVQISEVWVGVAGSHIKSFDSRGMVAIRDNEVAKGDIQRVVEAAKAVSVPGDREVIHVIPREFKVDDQDGINDPIGMSGVRLEASVHIVTASHTAVQNIIKCTERAGLKVSGMVLEQYAASLSVLTPDERQLGAIIVDLGGGNSEICMIVQGSLAYTASVALGGSHITNDVAVGLRTPQQNAEMLKRKYGCALSSLVNAEETIEVEGVGGRKERTVYKQHLSEVIEPRAEEVLSFIQAEIQKSGLIGLVGSGVVLTGGGSLLDGVVELGEFVFDMPVRRGEPAGFGGLVDAVKSSQFDTVTGILIYAEQQIRTNKVKISRRSASGWMEKLRSLLDPV